MFNILLSISIRRIARFVIDNWVIFAVGAFVVCTAMIVWLIREVIKSGKEDADEDSDKSLVTAQTDRDRPGVLEETFEPEIVDIPEPAPEVFDEIPETKEPEPIAETEQTDITEDISSQEEPETIEEFPAFIIPEAKNEKATKKQEKRKAKEEKQRLKAQQAKKQKKDKKKGKKSKRRKKSFDLDSPELITESDYRLVTQRILKIRRKPRSILFAAAARNSLPITIPVNIAIQLAEDKHRCLLIDLDLKRNAIAKAFDIEDKPNPKHLRPIPCPTSIQELFVWPAHNFTRSRHMNIISLVRAAGEKFDYVLISAPYFTGSPDRVQIAAATEFSFIFTQDSAQGELLDTIIELTNCRILAHYQITG